MKIKAENTQRFMNHCNLLAHLTKEAPEGNAWYHGMEVYKKLRRIELKENRRMCSECNTGGDDEKASERTRQAVARLLPNLHGFFINGDPRGYTLKVKSETVKAEYSGMYTDWGGYGILAPEF